MDPTTESDKSCENYLLKMRHDTKEFSDLPLIKANFNVCKLGQSDPFLVHMSLGGKVIAGSDIRSLK
jgi:hypothetical protein